MEPIIEGKFQQVLDGRKKFDFPTCHIGQSGRSYVCYISSDAARILDDIGPVNWYLNDNYIVCLPSKAVTAFKPMYFKGRTKGYCFPKVLITNRTVKPGYYRLYRYKSGFAFKRYATLEVAK